MRKPFNLKEARAGATLRANYENEAVDLICDDDRALIVLIKGEDSTGKQYRHLVEINSEGISVDPRYRTTVITIHVPDPPKPACQNCTYWSNKGTEYKIGRCDYIGIDDHKSLLSPKTRENAIIRVEVSDDSGLDVSLVTRPVFYCNEHKPM